MLQEIGKQLSKRKSQLLKRITLIVWPYILLGVVGYIVNFFYDIRSLINSHLIVSVIVLFTYVLLAGVYGIIIRFIFNIEKQIWVDSYFDRRELDPKDSWKISVKLFWPALWFRLNIFWKYYFLPITATVLGLILCTWIMSQYAYKYESLLWVLISIPLLFVIALCIYAYFLKIRLRYTWFVFLDTFGSSYSFRNLVDEMNKLNNISKTETFKKSLIANLGADTVKGVTSIAIQGITSGISMLGNSGQLLGGVLRVYGDEANRQITDMANISSQYLLYRFARKELYGQEQAVNDSIYNMKLD